MLDSSQPWPGVFLFRKPPAVLGGHDPGVHPGEEFGPLADLAPRGFDDHPVPLPDALPGGGLRVDLDQGVPVKLPEPGDLAVFGMEKSGLPGPGDQDVGVVPRRVPAC